MTAVLTGPVLLPDGTPMAGAQVKVELVSGNARSVGHVYENGGSARVAPAPTEVDADGNFTVEVPTLAEENVYPPSSYYTVTVGGGRWPKFTRKIKPINDSTYVISDPTIGGETEDLLPPDFVQMVPDLTTEDIDLAVAAYLVANPVDVETEVAAALAADPPLLVSNNGSDIVDDDGFRLAIGAASDSDVAATIAALESRIANLETFISTNVIVTASGVTSVVLSFPGGIPTFAVDE